MAVMMPIIMPAAAAWLIACNEPETAATERNEALIASMTKLEGDTSRVRDAIVRGDLARARAIASEIATSAQAVSPPGPKGADEAFRLALAEISGAKTLAEAALALGRTAETCAACHTGANVKTSERPVWQVEATPAEMARHAMDVDRLWLALIRPSNEDLATAVAGLEAAANDSEATGIDLRLRDLGRALRDAQPQQRAAAFGDILMACADCHSAGKPMPRPKLEGVVLPPMADTMDDHFVRLMELELAVMGGDLSDVHRAATALATAPPDPKLPEQARPFFDTIHKAANRAATAQNLLDAGKATAELMVACGNCHTATGGGPKDTIGTPPGEPHMGRHVFGAYWMAYGLFAPDERAWVGGTKALTESSLLPDNWQPPEGAAPLDKEIHTLAEMARSAVSIPQRAEIYGQLLAACAPCHQQLPR